jgi:endonuclease-3
MMSDRASPEPVEKRRPFDIEVALARIREAVAPYPKAALFALAEEGYDSVFQQLVACIVSIRTFDEVTVEVARRALAAAPTPEKMAELSVEEIDTLIRESTFHEAKAPQIRDIARRAVAEMGGQIPCDEAVLRSFRGVGPKCANLVLGIACGQPGIAVDIHVHRVVGRWGYVSAKTPEKTMAALQERLPREHWIELNSLLVPFGKHVCTGQLPRCSTCPVADMCRRVGVARHR